MKRLLLSFSLTLILGLWAGWPSPSAAAVPDGKVTVHPAVGVAGNFGTWTVTYRVGGSGIRQGGGIRVQLPDTWHAAPRNSAKRLQATDPQGDHYVSARVSRRGVAIKTTVEGETDTYLVKSGRPGLDGRSERYVFVVRVTVSKGTLRAGDEISVIYGDTSQGSRGMTAGIVSTRPEPVLLAVSATGKGDFELHPDRPTLQTFGGQVTELMLVGPSTLVVGKPAELHLSVLDSNHNADTSFREKVTLQVLQGQADVPAGVQFEPGKGWVTVKFTPRKAGLLRLRATARNRILTANSNPLLVFEREPPWKLYWGDLHSHTQYSHDGVGNQSFDYARFVTSLDFYAMTDHSSVPEGGFYTGLGPQVWDEYTKLTEQHNDPGNFVTLHAYEASFGRPYGHHNVYFRGRPGPLLAPENVTLPELWKALTAGQALTDPHHPGKFPQPVLWQPHDPERRRNFEIYSAHGLSEAFDPTHPLAFEQSDFTSAGRSIRGPQFAQDAWIAGLEVSTIAASDDHRSHPGQPHWGLAAVRATGLTRGEIFDGLSNRRTYGTTGARILLDFSVNGTQMGHRAKADGPPLLKIEAHGTAPIAWVEVLRYSKLDGGFKVIFRLRPDGLDFTWSNRDIGFQDDSIYYVRLQQEGMIRNRVAMAWSSPIWVKKVGD